MIRHSGDAEWAGKYSLRGVMDAVMYLLKADSPRSPLPGMARALLPFEARDFPPRGFRRCRADWRRVPREALRPVAGRIRSGFGGRPRAGRVSSRLPDVA